MEALVRSLDVPLVEVTPLHGRGYPGYRTRSFRLRLADGRVLKGRECVSRNRAVAIEYVLRRVDHLGLPRLLGRAGRALLTEWVEGRAPADHDWTPARLRECGALLACFHGVPVPEDSPRSRPHTIAARRAKYESDLSMLVRAGALEEREAQRAFTRAMEEEPQHCSLSFVHRDFCAENMVIRPSGAVMVVDNETLAVDACEHDLGRTWYRWPMEPEQRDAFLAGYEEHRSAREFVRHQGYWTLLALAGAAVFRRSQSAAAADVPLARLRALQV